MAGLRKRLAETFIFNPELIRNLRSSLRRNRIILLVLLSLGACAFNIILCLWSETPSRYYHNRRSINAQEVARAFRYAFFIALSVQLALLVLGSISLVSAAVAGERDLKTWDIQRMTPLSPLSLAWGKLIGANAGVWVVVLSAFPAQAVSVMAGGIDLEILLQGWLLVIAGGVLYGAFVLAVSSTCESRRNAVGLALMAVAAFGFVALAGMESQTGWPLGGLNPGVVVGGMLEENRHRWGPPMYKWSAFFWVDIDMVWASIAWEFLAAWALLAGAARLVRETGATLWSKWQACAVFGAASLAAVGACWELRGPGGWQQEEAQIGCSVSMVLGAAIMAFVMTPCYSSARAWIRSGAVAPVRWRGFLLGERSPATSVMVIFWMMSSLVMLVIGRPERALGAALVAAPALLALTALVGICTTALKKHGKVLAFGIISAWCLVMGIGAAIAESEEVLFACFPPVAIGVILDKGYRGDGMEAFAGALVLWTIVCAFLVMVWGGQVTRLRMIMAKLARR